MASSTSPPRVDVPSNLKNFLGAVTPKVLTQTQSMDLDQSVVEDDGDFFLGDLWHCYDKWSAYGLGIPIVLNSSENVVQYFTPHLSSIQLYTTKPFIKERNGGSVSENHTLSDIRGSDPLAHIYLKYEESISPYWRVPFTDKIAELREEFTGINSLKSSDLSPASWMSIMWKPIYHIPRHEKVNGLSTYFLTYHTLSSHFQGSKDAKGIESERFLKPNPESNLRNYIALTPFGLSSLNMCGDIWINQEAGDYELLIDLHCAVDSWLKQLGVCHGDFDYYNRKNQESGSIFK